MMSDRALSRTRLVGKSTRVDACIVVGMNGIRRPPPYFVLLCAHAKRSGSELVEVEGQPGRFPTQEVAERLRDQFELPSSYRDVNPKLRAVFYAKTAESAQTAALLLRGVAPNSSRVSPGHLAAIRSACAKGTRPLDQSADIVGAGPAVPVRPCALLLPTSFQAGDDTGLAACLLEAARTGEIRSSCPAGQQCCRTDLNLTARPGNAVLVIGHRPQLSWLTDEMMRSNRRYWRGRPMSGAPFSPGEVVCIRFTPSPRASSRILWTISPDDRSAAAEIIDKIKSKMETAKLLGGLISLLLGALLGVLLDGKKLAALAEITWAGVSAKTAVGVSSALLFLATVLFLASYYSYDRLLMPARFWVERRPPRGDR